MCLTPAAALLLLYCCSRLLRSAGAKHALAEVFRRVVQYKMVGAVGGATMGSSGGHAGGSASPGAAW